MRLAPWDAPNHPAVFMLSHAHTSFSRAIFSIGTDLEEDRSVRPEPQAGGLDHVFVGTCNLFFRRAAQVDERQLLPRRGARNLGGRERSAEQEFDIPVMLCSG